MSIEESFILMGLAFSQPIATIQVITSSQLLHSQLMDVTTYNVIYILLDLVRI